MKKNKKLKIKNGVMENYKNMLEVLDLEQNSYSKIAKGVYKNGQDSLQLMKWMCCYER